MKKIVLFLAVASVAGAGAAGAIAHPQARAVQAKTVTIVMHDPGCHWFSVNGAYLKTYSIKGPVSLFNIDEAAMIVRGPKGTQHDKVGGRLLLGKGVYRITMVGQAPDDNHLKLTVK